MNRIELLDKVSGIFKTYGTSIIDYLNKNTIDPEIEESMITFKQRVKEISQIADDLDKTLSIQYGSSTIYNKEIITIQSTLEDIEKSIDNLICNEFISSKVNYKNNLLVITLIFNDNSISTYRDKKHHYMSSKMHLETMNLELLSTGKFKWYTVNKNFGYNNKICKITLKRDNKLLHNWLKGKLLSDIQSKYTGYQIELLLP